MIKSMTGYGKGEVTSANGRIVVEVRSVNHRYGEITTKLPRPLLSMEHAVRKCVAERVKRGKIELFVQWQEGAAAASLPAVNLPLARAYHGAFTSLKESLGLEGPITLGLIAAQKDVLMTGEGEVSLDLVLDDVLAAVRTAVEALDAMRFREGALLADDLRGRRQTVADLAAAVRTRAPLAVAETVSRMRERVAQLAGESGLDETRLAQEIALMADRCDMTEELVRFESHLQQFDEALEVSEPVGRKLDFLLQELNREANTMGSKANDAAITAYVVQLKAELEKVREQVQNIE